MRFLELYIYLTELTWKQKPFVKKQIKNHTRKQNSNTSLLVTREIRMCVNRPGHDKVSKFSIYFLGFIVVFRKLFTIISGNEKVFDPTKKINIDTKLSSVVVINNFF